ncbi:50S ribosomal protein L29 [Enterococcus sp. BWM-S5]|uniref:50S ribosomal protein L29 n=1 Tax=Enterococcus larvae TaxID=2794352 RepID=A0ABS4CJY9_9ENTE|nr:50S ribosomal protein L29 [Enterococcus larvae]MBP1046436.1 50S ribosomal protein L29 [Enterococcus larvae]
MKEKLLAYGFKVTEEDGEECLIKVISKIGDRFQTRLRYYDNPSVFGSQNQIYIDRDFLRGLETIKESDVINNHNELHSGAKKNWLKFKEEFPEIKSAI